MKKVVAGFGVFEYPSWNDCEETQRHQHNRNNREPSVDLLQAVVVRLLLKLAHKAPGIEEKVKRLQVNQVREEIADCDAMKCKCVPF